MRACNSAICGSSLSSCAEWMHARMQVEAATSADAEAAQPASSANAVEDAAFVDACRSFMAPAAARCDALTAAYQHCVQELRGMAEYFQVRHPNPRTRTHARFSFTSLRVQPMRPWAPPRLRHAACPF